MPVAEDLRAAKDLIRQPERWCQGAYARDSLGAEVEPDDERASQWCGVGAVMRTAPGPGRDASLVALAEAIQPDEILWEVDDAVELVAEINDRARYKSKRPDLAFRHIHRVYDQAIKRAEERERDAA